MTPDAQQTFGGHGSNTEVPCFLVVDDEEYARHALRRLLKIILGHGKFELFEAACGRDAIEVLDRVSVQCVLLDIEMPGGDGTEWMPRMLERRPSAAIVMVTGVHDERRAVDAMKNGALDYLVKGSISPWSLERAISGALDKIGMRLAMERQREQLLIAERHRVMIESLGAACHHLGQPLSVVTFCLDILRRQQTGPNMGKLIADCAEAVDDVNRVLEKLRHVATYRTEPYIGVDSDSHMVRERILKIDPMDEDGPSGVKGGQQAGCPGK